MSAPPLSIPHKTSVLAAKVLAEFRPTTPAHLRPAAIERLVEETRADERIDVRTLRLTALRLFGPR